MAREDFSIEELESLRGLLATAVGAEGDVAVERIADSFFGLSALFEADFEHIYDVCQSTAVANAIRLAVALHKRRLTEHIKFNKRLINRCLHLTTTFSSVAKNLEKNTRRLQSVIFAYQIMLLQHNSQSVL